MFAKQKPFRFRKKHGQISIITAPRKAAMEPQLARAADGRPSRIGPIDIYTS
jgi:hypothetical protein